MFSFYLTLGINLNLNEGKGGVVQLARILDWQSRGRGFESHLLH